MSEPYTPTESELIAASIGTGYLLSARRAQEAIARIKAEAWDEGFRASDACWTETANITTPDEERTSPYNPYRENGETT